MKTDIYARNNEDGLTFGPHGFFPFSTMKRSTRKRLNTLTKRLDDLQDLDESSDEFDNDVVPVICELVEAMLLGADGLGAKLHQDYMDDSIGLLQLQQAQALIMANVAAQSAAGNA